MTACLIIPAWSIAIAGILLFAVGFKLCHMEYQYSTKGEVDLLVTIVGAILLCIGILATIFGLMPYAYLIPCITVAP